MENVFYKRKDRKRKTNKQTWSLRIYLAREKKNLSIHCLNSIKKNQECRNLNPDVSPWPWSPKQGHPTALFGSAICSLTNSNPAVCLRGAGRDSVAPGDQRLAQPHNLLDGTDCAAAVEEAELSSYQDPSTQPASIFHTLQARAEVLRGVWAFCDKPPEYTPFSLLPTELYFPYCVWARERGSQVWGSERHLSHPGRRFSSKSREGCSAVLTRFSLVSRVISCCRLASMRASGGSCRFWASSCCCRLFSSFRLWISPRRASASFSWLLFWDCSWDSRSLWRSHTGRKGRWHLSPYLVGVRLCAHLQGQKNGDSVVSV